MYFPDLSPYRYTDGSEYDELGTVSIGWLDRKHAFTRGKTSEVFKQSLLVYCANSVNGMRGFHQCHFCNHSQDSLLMKPVCAHIYGKKVLLGSAEIRVIYGESVYAAPNLIYHYVAEHDYKPPQEFIDAVLNGPLPGSPQYEEMRKKYWDSAFKIHPEFEGETEPNER